MGGETKADGEPPKPPKPPRKESEMRNQIRRFEKETRLLEQEKRYERRVKTSSK